VGTVHHWIVKAHEFAHEHTCQNLTACMHDRMTAWKHVSMKDHQCCSVIIKEGALNQRSPQLQPFQELTNPARKTHPREQAILHVGANIVKHSDGVLIAGDMFL
jgi:hypothetical protein